MAGNHNNHASAVPGSGHNSESTPLLPTVSNHVAHDHDDGHNGGHENEGESGRSGFHPKHFLAVLWRSSCTASMFVNVLWPFVPIAIVLNFLPGLHLWKFVTAYIAVIPSANLLGFAGQEFARKMPKVAGILIETTFGSIIEIILFVVLIAKHDPDASGEEGNLIPIIQAAILGSILTNSGQATSIALIVAFILYIWYQASSQHSIFDEVIEMDEHRDADRETDMEKAKFTMTETIIAIVISLVFVALLLVFLVEKIEHVVEAGIPDQFLGLILLPLVEKAAEHLTAIDEAWDGVINVALYHCLGPSIQTALFNGPLIVLISWALGKPMDLNFEIFMIALLVLSILVVGNFLRDGESNWLEGALLVVIYAIIAIACWYYPNPDVATSNGFEGSEFINVTMSVDTLRQLQQLLNANLEQ
ncbi:hypothetical protein QQX98_010722 [Neonectria punicea]|uniref:Sodium/calcium exchanger membrane region domain-containing protein n=1 Tax=Neonectria punicea TaxID=979145 RepID=A0ABR1GNM9_9HYPO